MEAAVKLKPTPTEPVVRFGPARNDRQLFPFSYEVGTQSLFKGTKRLISSRAKIQARLLGVLIANRRVVLSKSLLEKMVWGTDNQIESDFAAMYRTITQLRKSLGDEAENPEYILTKDDGYEFIGTIEGISDTSTALGPSDSIDARLRTDGPVRRLTPNWDMPQAVSYWEPDLAGQELKSVSCVIETESPYFRFGFKLMSKDGRTFGDVIKTSDTNLIVHISRNDWDRPQIGVSKDDLFLTCYLSLRTIVADQKLFSARKRLVARFELKIDAHRNAEIFINGESRYALPVPTEICRRIAIMAWGDNNPFEVVVSNLEVLTS
jgi:DNA-binding winged helix-turn-helix (wHTH) protein